MVAAVYLLTVLASVAQSASSKLFHRHSANSAIFNALKACTALLFFSALAAFGFTFHLPTLLFGLFYGVSLCISMYTGYRALCLGPMALTGMLVSFSVVIPLLWGITVGRETPTPLQYFAFSLLLVALVLTNADQIKAGQARQKDYGLWLFFVCVTFLANGVCSVLQAQHQALYPEAYSREFMLFAMLLSSVVFVCAALVKAPLREFKAIKGKRYGVLSGVANGTANLLTLLLAGMENASVLFPVISAGTVLVSLLCGRLFFGERLRGNHYAALAAGIAAVVLMKL